MFKVKLPEGVYLKSKRRYLAMESNLDSNTATTLYPQYLWERRHCYNIPLIGLAMPLRPRCIDHKLHFLWRHQGNNLLQHMISMRGLQCHPHPALKAAGQQLFLLVICHIQGSLHQLGAILAVRQVPAILNHLSQQLPALWTVGLHELFVGPVTVPTGPTTGGCRGPGWLWGGAGGHTLQLPRGEGSLRYGWRGSIWSCLHLRLRLGVLRHGHHDQGHHLIGPDRGEIQGTIDAIDAIEGLSLLSIVHPHGLAQKCSSLRHLWHVMHRCFTGLPGPSTFILTGSLPAILSMHMRLGHQVIPVASCVARFMALPHPVNSTSSSHHPSPQAASRAVGMLKACHPIQVQKCANKVCLQILVKLPLACVTTFFFFM